MIEIVALVLSSLLNGLLGLLVFYKNPESATNKLFIGLTASFILWSIADYLSLHPLWFSQLILIRLNLFFAAPLCLMVYLTFTTFPATLMQGSSLRRRVAVGYTMVVMGLTLTPFVFKSLHVSSGGSANPVPSFGILFFGLLVLVLLGGGIVTLWKKYRHSKGKLRMQFRYVIMGLGGTFGLIFITNFLLVVALNNSSFVALGPSFTLIFTGALAYAIVKHHLFDIRKAAARGLGYVLTLVTLSVVYSFFVFGVSTLFLSDQQINSRVQVVYTVLALVLAFSFQPIKHYFDRFSNRIFFRDGYQPQEFIDQLNQVLVTYVDLKPLLANSITVIREFLKAESCAFVIRETAYSPLRIISNQAIKLDEATISKIWPNLVHTHQKVLITDDLEEEHPELARQLQKRDVAAMVRLVPNLDDSTTIAGAIILGPKRSGDVYSHQDVQILEIIANELLIAIQNAVRFEEIENFNQTLQGRITDATRQLQRTNVKLEALDETKDDFISMASHQLRTPLTSVKGYLSLVLDGDAGPINEQQQKMLTQSYVSAQRMVYLIADLLNVSRLKTGKFVIDAHPTNLADVIQEEIDQLKETAAARKIKLTYQAPKTFPLLMLDDVKTRQVVMNFIDNAIYYTPAGGHIQIHAEDKPSTIEIRVEDNGIGVPKSEQQHLFTKFYRAGNARKARPDGTGLGLYMAKKVVAAQGGAILFNSKEGVGSTFGFTFPKSKLAVPANTPDLKSVDVK